MKHRLKTWENFYSAVEAGEKTFEVRRNDRGFQKGDILILDRYEAPGHYRTTIKAEMRVEVTYVLTGEAFGIKDGFCVMGIKPTP